MFGWVPKGHKVISKPWGINHMYSIPWAATGPNFGSMQPWHIFNGVLCGHGWKFDPPLSRLLLGNLSVLITAMKLKLKNSTSLGLYGAPKLVSIFRYSRVH